MEVYPGSLKTKDKDGNLAIHSLSENTKQMENRDKVILTMIDLYPDSLRLKDNDGNTPLHSFIENPSQINNREKVIGVMVKEYEGALTEKDSLSLLLLIASHVMQQVPHSLSSFKFACRLLFFNYIL